MRQNVNLLLSLPKPKKEILSAVHIMQILGVLLLALILLSGINLWGIKKQNKKLLALIEQQTKLRAEFSRYSRYKSTSSTKGHNIEEEKNLLRILANKQKLKVNGFSDYLLALAQYTPCGLWLNNITIRQNTINLTGNADSPETIPDFLQALRQSYRFRSLNFKVFDVSKKGDKPLGFIMSTIEGNSA